MNSLSPIQWALLPLKKYATFSGRAPRAEFWWFFLFVMIIYFAMVIAAFVIIGGAMAQSQSPLGMIGAFGIVGIFIGLFWLAIIIPTIAVQVRRIHDLDRSGWWVGAYYIVYLVYMVTSFATAASGGEPTIGGSLVALIIALGFFAYSIVLLIFYCLAGTKGANRYGPDPYGADVSEVFA